MSPAYIIAAYQIQADCTLCNKCWWHCRSQDVCPCCSYQESQFQDACQTSWYCCSQHKIFGRKHIWSMLYKISNTWYIPGGSVHLPSNGCHWKLQGLKHKLDLEDDEEQNSEDQEMQVLTWHIQLTALMPLSSVWDLCCNPVGWKTEMYHDETWNHYISFLFLRKRCPMLPRRVLERQCSSGYVDAKAKSQSSNHAQHRLLNKKVNTKKNSHDTSTISLWDLQDLAELYFAFDLAQPLFLLLLDQNFEMLLLHQFSVDCLETWTVGSHICSPSACTTTLYNITIFYFHVLGTHKAISKVK